MVASVRDVKRGSTSEEGKSTFNLKSLTLVVLGFIISVALVNCTKWIYVQYHFKYPLFLTGTHMFASYIAAAISLWVFNLVPDRPILTIKEQMITVVPFSVAGAISLGAANMALVYLFPSFHAMLQNSTPIWTVICAVLLQKKSFNWWAYIALIPVCGGGAICAFGEKSDFLWIGVFISLAAAALRGVKASLQAIILRGAGKKIDSVSLLYYSSPFNLGLFVIASLINEGHNPWLDYLLLPGGGQMWVWIAAFMAASFNMIGFLTIGYLGAVNAMVIGNMKSPTTIMASCLIFGNIVSLKQIIGFSIGLAGVILYDRLGKEVEKSIPYSSVENEEKLEIEFGLVEGGQEDHQIIQELVVEKELVEKIGAPSIIFDINGNPIHTSNNSTNGVINLSESESDVQKNQSPTTSKLLVEVPPMITKISTSKVTQKVQEVSVKKDSGITPSKGGGGI